jgi:hypothetical protein
LITILRQFYPGKPFNATLRWLSKQWKEDAVIWAITLKTFVSTITDVVQIRRAGKTGVEKQIIW